MSRGVLGRWTRAQPPGGKGSEAVRLLPLAAAGERVAGPDEADNDQPENPEITGIAAERHHAENDDGDDGRDNPAGDPGSSERGFVFLLEILGQLLDLQRRFPSGLSCRFHASTTSLREGARLPLARRGRKRSRIVYYRTSRSKNSMIPCAAPCGHWCG